MASQDPDDALIEVSAVMPCLNEARTIGTCIRKAQSFFAGAGITGEVVVADNGSSDGSQEIARALGARVIDVAQRGYGAALAGGIGAARGQIIVMGDADDSYDWTAIGPFVEQVRGGADLVMGNRFRGGIRPGAMPRLHRYFGNPILSLVARLAFRAPIGDFHCGMRALSRAASARMRLRTVGMEFATEMVANAMLAKLRISEVPVILYPDGRNRAPHLRSFRDGWRHLRFIATYAPDHLFLLPSLVALLSGGLLVGATAAGPLAIGSLYLGIHWLVLGSLLTVSGLSLIVFGILAKLIIHRAHPGVAGGLVSWILERFRVEHGILISLALAVPGALVEFAILTGFIVAGGGPSEGTIHPAIFGATLFVAGLLVGFSSFLVRLVVEEMPPAS